MNILVDTHTHTLASTHAMSTLIENAKEAAKSGLEMICMTDHTPALPDAPHIWHFETLHRLPKVIEGVKIKYGAEANLLDDEGNIDLPLRLQRKLDMMVASIHPPVYPYYDDKTVTKTYLAAVKNPDITILGHTGDIRFPYNIDEVTAAAAEYDSCIEINNNSCKNPKNVDKYRKIIEACIKNNTKICVSSDSHTAFEVGNFEHATALLEEANFPEDLIANLNAERFEEHLKLKKSQSNLNIQD